MSATPRPWPEVEYDNDTGPRDESFRQWWGIPGVADFRRKEDAHLARRAVNAHDALVAAVDRLLPYTLGRMRALEREGNSCVDIARNDAERARAALKLAEEGS